MAGPGHAEGPRGQEGLGICVGGGLEEVVALTANEPQGATLARGGGMGSWLWEGVLDLEVDTFVGVRPGGEEAPAPAPAGLVGGVVKRGLRNWKEGSE